MSHHHPWKLLLILFRWKKAPVLLFHLICRSGITSRENKHLRISFNKNPDTLITTMHVADNNSMLVWFSWDVGADGKFKASGPLKRINLWLHGLTFLRRSKKLGEPRSNQSPYTDYFLCIEMAAKRTPTHHPSQIQTKIKLIPLPTILCLKPLQGICATAISS